MSMTVNGDALQKELAKLTEAEEIMKAEKAKEVRDQDKLMSRNEVIGGVMMYNTHLIPRKMLGIWQEALKLMPEHVAKTLVIHRNVDTKLVKWEDDVHGKYYPGAMTAAINLDNLIKNAHDAATEEDSTLSILCSEWLTLLLVGIHEVSHSFMGGPDMHSDEEVDEYSHYLLAKLAKVIDIEPVVGTDYFSREVQEHIDLLPELDLEKDTWAKKQIQMHHQRILFEAADGSGSLSDIRTLVKIAYSSDEDMNDPLWSKDVYDVIIDNPPGTAPYVAPTISEEGVAAATTIPIVVQDQEAAPAQQLFDEDGSPLSVPEFVAIPGQTAAGATPTIDMVQVQAQQQSIQQPVQQQTVVAQATREITAEPWYNNVLPTPAITLSKQEIWDVQDKVFAMLFHHMWAACQFTNTGTFLAKERIHDRLDLMSIPGAEQLFLGMSCGMGSNHEWAQDVDIWRNPAHPGKVAGWQTKGRHNDVLNKVVREICYILTHNVGGQFGMKIVCKFQDPTKKSTTGPLAAQGMPIMWVYRVGDRARDIKQVFMYKVTFCNEKGKALVEGANPIRVDDLRGSRKVV